MRYLATSAVLGLLPIPPETNSGDANRNQHVPSEELQHSHKKYALLGDSKRMATKAALARLRRALGINVSGHWGSQMLKRRVARYKILGRGYGNQRIHLLLNHEDEADAKARELAAIPGQSPVALIDTDSERGVKFYFADGHVCTVVRKSPR
jgi:hypothetical protein